MTSEYLKVLEDEIKKTKDENEYHFRLAKRNNEKKELEEDSKLKDSNTQIEQNIQEENSKDKDENQKVEEKESQKEENNNIKSVEINLNKEKKKLNLENDDEKNNNINIDEEYNINNINFENSISLNSIHTCQCCSKEFDPKNRIPYLLKCNHIFCKKCLESYFSDEDGIKCPIDGFMGKTLNDLKKINNIIKNKKNKNNKKNRNQNISHDLNKNSKSYKEIIRSKQKDLLNNYKINTFDKIKGYINDYNHLQKSNSNSKYINSNLRNNNKYSKNNKKKRLNKYSSFIENNKINISNLDKNRSNNMNDETFQYEEENEEAEDDENSQNYCSIHPKQKLSHFVEDTKELICIYCAFNKLKNNPNIQIKEMPEKCKEYLNDLDIIIENNQKYAQIIQNSMNDIEENKEKEEKKIIEIYEQLLNILVSNRNNYLIKIEELYQENANNMNQKLENFDEIIEVAENLKEDFKNISSLAPYEFNHLTQTFNKFIREINDKNLSNLEIIQYNFSHDEINKVIKYLNNFADVKNRKKICRFDLLKNSKNDNFEEVNNHNQNHNGFNNNINLIKNGIDNYYKQNKKINFLTSKNKSKNLNIKNNFLSFNNSNNNLRFNLNYKDKNNNNKFSTIYNSRNILNNYKDNNYNDSTSESITTSLNKYIASTNMIRDSLYNNNKFSTINYKNFDNYINNKKPKESKNIMILNKYKYPIKKN